MRNLKIDIEKRCDGNLPDEAKVLAILELTSIRCSMLRVGKDNWVRGILMGFCVGLAFLSSLAAIATHDTTIFILAVINIVCAFVHHYRRHRDINNLNEAFDDAIRKITNDSVLSEEIQQDGEG